ncbi:TRIM25 [Mytilus coruscus]|uniref:TRIM25 n=1 Tax=Mytilus coruscus TaxID=42192 RepID=A0A6J8C102_MYTCO|nr:TRIM25 [Mytilus coruscus]
MTEREMHCEPCEHNGEVKLAETWCTDCEEGFCHFCIRVHKVTKLSKHHQLISIADRIKTDQLKINRMCDEHKKTFGYFCSQHDKILCLKCVQLHHSSCDISDLIDASNGAKTSTALSDVETTIHELLKNLELNIKKCNEADEDLKLQKEKVVTEVKIFREKVNNQLNILQDTLLKELTSCYKNHQLKLNDYKHRFLQQQKSLLQHKDKTITLKTLASDTQTFIGTKEIDVLVGKDVDLIKKTIRQYPVYNIYLLFDSKLESLLLSIKRFGVVKVQTTTGSQHFIEPKEKQAQESSTPVSNKSNTISLKLRRRLSLPVGNNDMMLTSCAILQNNKLMFADSSNKRLIIHAENGEFERYVQLNDQPFDITVQNENIVYVTFRRGKNLIVAFDYINYRFKETKDISKTGDISFWGISHNSDGDLFILSFPEGIKIITGDGVEKLIRLNIRNVYNLTINNSKMYFTSRDNNTLHCYETSGKKMWSFKHDKLRCSSHSSLPLATDGQGNIFVCGPLDDVVMCVSDDGKRHKVILDKSDKLNKPRGIFFDKLSGRLLICNQENGHAALYDIVYGNG